MLKWLLVVLLVALSGIALGASFSSAKDAEQKRFRDAASAIGTTFAIPVDEALENPEVVAGALKRAASVSGSNIFRTSLGYKADGKEFTAHYVWLTTAETHFFDAFRLRNGHFLSVQETHNGRDYLSTLSTNAREQRGVLDGLGANPSVTIHGLDAAFAALPTPGRYMVECATPKICGEFFDSLVGDLVAHGVSLDRDKLLTETSHGGAVGRSGATMWNLAIAAALVATAILAAYRQLYEAKRTAVLRLNGYGALTAWFAVSGRLVLATTLCSGGAAVAVACLIPGSTPALVLAVGTRIIAVSVLALMATLVTAIYIRRIRVYEALKNRKDTRLLAGLNAGLKLGLGAALIISGASTAGSLNTMKQAESRLHAWQATSGYGVFQPTYIGNDFNEIQTGGHATDDAEAAQLYPVLEARGGLYVDASDYEVAALEQPFPENGYRSITVNTNYLAQYPVIDPHRDAVTVSDDDSDWILLVPETMRAESAQISSYFQSTRSGGDNGSESVAQTEKNVFGRDVPAAIIDQRVKIVWTANDQRAFAFNPDVAPSDGNSVVDPIIQVMTARNSVASDRLNAITGGPGGALKVRLTENDAERTLAELGPTLRRLHLDDNLQSLVTLDDYALAELQELQFGIRYSLTELAVVFTAFVVLAIQCATLLFEQDARRVAVRRLLGFGFASRHRLFFTVFAATWCALFLGVFALYEGPGARFSAPPPGVAIPLGVGAVFLLVDAAVAAAALTFIERRRITTVLKGEF